MKLLSAPRQPFVGLAAMAGLGIILAEFFPLSSSALVATAIIIALCAVATPALAKIGRNICNRWSWLLPAAQFSNQQYRRAADRGSAW